MENCTKFVQLILSKIIKIVATSCQIFRLKCTKFDFGWGCAPDPARGTHSVPPNPLAGFKGHTSKGRAGKGRAGARGQEGGRGGDEERGGKRGRGRGGEGIGEGIIVLEDCQLRTLDLPLRVNMLYKLFTYVLTSCSYLCIVLQISFSVSVLEVLSNVDHVIFAAFNTVSGHFAPMRLHFAINSGQLAKLERLIESGVDLNFAAPSNGQTPLVLSVLSQRVDMASALVKAGADVRVAEKTSWRRRPIQLAAAGGHCALVADTLRQSPDEVRSVDAMLFTPLHNAAVGGHVDVVRLLVDAGAEVDAADDRSRTPLIRAAEYGHAAVVELLVGRGAQLDWVDAFGWTALYQSTLCGQRDMVEHLLRLGADVDGAGGESPVLAAAGGATPRSLGTLRNANIDFYMRRCRATTVPLHQAASTALRPRRCFPDILDLLVDHGADVRVRDSDGLSPVRLAALAGRSLAVSLLVSAGADLTSEDWIVDQRWPTAIADDATLCGWLDDVAASRVRPLRELCRLVIRRRVRPRIRQSLVVLPLPEYLINYLQITI